MPARTEERAATAEPRAATDRGVSADAITVGAVLLQLSTANTVGLAPDNYETENQRRGYQAFVDDINAAGGIHGRRVNIRFAIADPFDPDSARAACLALTEDAQVFAVFAMPGYGGPESLCITEDHRTPLLGASTYPREYYRRSQDLLVTDLPAVERMMDQWASVLVSSGAVRGKRIGILGDEADGGDREGADALEAALKKLGHAPTYRSRLSEDLQTGAGQVSLEVQRMRSAGVDYVLLPTNFVYSTSFVQTADSQGYRPGYSVSALQGMATDALTENMPRSFDGALGFAGTRLGIIEARDGVPEPAVDRTCRERYNRATGSRHPYGSTQPALFLCSQVQLFRRAANAAGPDLTRDTFRRAITGLGRFERPGSYGGSYAPGKTDYLDEGRILRWHAECRCFHLDGPPRSG